MRTLISIILLLPVCVLAQVGTGTTTPKGMLDIYSDTAGLVVPRVTNIESVTDGNGNAAVDGTVVYDISRQKVCFKIDGCWITIGEDSGGNAETAVIVKDFQTVSNYIKASNTEASDVFGNALSISEDGNFLAVGAPYESSNATGIGGNQSNNSANVSGAVYIYRRTGSTWAQEAYIKASNSETGDLFGWAVSLDADGTRLAVVSDGEDSSATGINGNQNDNSANASGAVYVFVRSGSTWTQEAYIKASNTEAGDHFGGASISLSSDGSRLVVPSSDDSNATGINGNQNDNSAANSGAAYVFRRTGTNWAQEAYIKASNTDAGDSFGSRIALSGDGLRLIVAASSEQSNATGIGGNQSDNSLTGAGAVYVFSRSGTVWSQEAYIKASNTGNRDYFGSSITINYDGSLFAASSPLDDAPSTGIGGSQTGGGAFDDYGSVFIFERNGTTWSQQEYIKPTTTDIKDLFGFTIVMSSDGLRLAVHVFSEDSNATGLNGNEADNSSSASGAVYVFDRSGSTWTQVSYIKAPNSDAGDSFGKVALSSGCSPILAVGVSAEDSSATGINGNQLDNSALESGAVYIIE